MNPHSLRSPHFPQRRPINPPLFSRALIFTSAVSSDTSDHFRNPILFRKLILVNISHRRDLDAEKVTRGERSIVGALLGNGARSFCSEYKIRCVRSGCELGFRGAVDVNRSPLECSTSYSYLRKQVLRT